MRRPSPETAPLLVGALLIGGGLLLRRVDPDLLALPSPARRRHRDRGMARAARRLRDGLARVLPGNLTGSLGRTLLISGAGLVLIRLLDMAVEEGEDLF